MCLNTKAAIKLQGGGKQKKQAVFGLPAHVEKVTGNEEQVFSVALRKQKIQQQTYRKKQDEFKAVEYHR